MDSVVQWTIVDDTWVGYATEGEWKLEDFRARYVPDFSSKSFSKYISGASDGFYVSSILRKEASELLKKRDPLPTIITDSFSVRCLVKAAQWLGVTRINSYSWNDIASATRYLQLSELEAKRVAATLEGLRSQCETQLKAKRIITTGSP